MLSTNLTVDSPLAFIIPVLVINSSGLAIFSSPNNNSILSAVERSQYGVVTALTQLVRNSAQVISIAVMTTIVVATMAASGFEPSLAAVTSEGGAEVAQAFVAGFRKACLVMGSLMLVGIVLSFLKSEKAPEAVGEAPPEGIEEAVQARE